MKGVDLDGLVDSLTLGELDDVEVAVGPLDTLRPMQLAVGCIWVLRRRDDPDYTLDDARGVKVTDLAGVDPTDAAETTGG